MCGITGVVGSLRGERATLQRMNDRLRHRGPDGEGFFWADDVGLAMRRLAIIDLTGGDQPIFNEDRSVCVVFNGEIYNFLELRAELEAPRPPLRDARATPRSSSTRTRSTARTASSGCGACSRWRSGTAASKRLLLARDRLGKKPLVYYADAPRRAGVRVRAAGAAGASRPCRARSTRARSTIT